MKKRTTVLVATAALVLGTVIGAWAKKAPLDSSIYAGKPPKEAAAGLLAIARSLAGKGSWENIAVGRVHYLSGDKAAGQAIFDGITGRKGEAGDWMRIGKIYYQAGEWDKAKSAFDRVLQMAPQDEDWLAEIGAFYNLKGDRARAEELFGRSFKVSSESPYNAEKAAGSYVGVVPD